MSTNPGTTPRSVGESLKSAGTLVALQAERTKLVQITLPNAYVELGKVIFRDGSRRPEFENLFAELDRLDAEKKKVKSGAEGRPASQSFGDRAKSLYAGAKDIAVTKTLDLRLRSVAITLGEAVYAKHGMNAGEHSLVRPIADALERVAKVDADISGEARGLGSEFVNDSSRLVSNTKTVVGNIFSPRRLMAIGISLACLALAVVVLYFVAWGVVSARRYKWEERGAHEYFLGSGLRLRAAAQSLVTKIFKEQLKKKVICVKVELGRKFADDCYHATATLSNGKSVRVTIRDAEEGVEVIIPDDQ